MAADNDLALGKGNSLNGSEDQARAAGLEAVAVGLDGLDRELGGGLLGDAELPGSAPFL